MQSLLDLVTQRAKYSAKKYGSVISANKVLVLAPHYDDEAIGAGGTILAYQDISVEVEIIYVTDGNRGGMKGQSGVRKEEAIRAWASYPHIQQFFWEIEDGNLSQRKSVFITKLKKHLEASKPDIIYTPWIFDSHPDHQNTTVFLKKALVQLGIDNVMIACYEVLCPLYANHTVNITKVYKRKKNLIACYKSQHFYLPIQNTIDYLSQFRAYAMRMRAFKYAEGFFVLPAEDFIAFISGVNDIDA